MTRYLGVRPAPLPALPEMTARAPTPAMRAAAQVWLGATAALTALDLETMAVARPGLPAQDLLTDRQYALLVVTAPGDAESALSNLESVRAVSAGEAEMRCTEYDVRDGFGIMNTRFLRCGLFSQCDGQRLPVLKSRGGDWVLRRGVPLGQDHLDFLMVVLAGTSGQYDAVLGEAIVFSPYQVCGLLGMSRNRVSLLRIKSWAADLMGTVIELHEPQGPCPERPRVSSFLGPLSHLTPRAVARLRASDKLPPAPVGSKVFWQVVVPAPVFSEFVCKGVFSGLRLDVRRALNSPFAKWLSSYMSTHEPGRALAFNIPQLAQAGGLNIATGTEHGRKNLRRAVRAAFAVLESGHLEVRRGRVKLPPETAQAAAAAGAPVFEVGGGAAAGVYRSRATQVAFRPLVKVLHPPGVQDPDTVYAMRV